MEDGLTTARDKLDWLKWVAGSAVLTGIVIIVAAFFTVKVCEPQLTATGSVVTVCRHLNMTDPPIIAFGAVIVALLGVFYSEISGFGFTLKRSVEDARATAEEAAREAKSASQSVTELRERLRAELAEAVQGNAKDFSGIEAGPQVPRRGRNIRITAERIAQLDRLSTYPSEGELMESARIMRNLSDKALQVLYNLADDIIFSIEMGRRIGQSGATLESSDELERAGLIRPAPNYPDDEGFVTLSETGESVGRLLTAQGNLPSELAGIQPRIGKAIASQQPQF